LTKGKQAQEEGLKSRVLCWGPFEKLKLELLYDSEIPFWGIYYKDLTSTYRRDSCISMLTAVLLTIAKTWKQPECLLAQDWVKLRW
jgi:hypothetical protein